MVSLSAAIFFYIVIIESEKFKFIQLICLFPVIPTILYLFALKFEKKKFYCLTVICWVSFLEVSKN